MLPHGRQRLSHRLIAAQANDVDLQQMSGAVELAAALRAFLSRVAGWGRSAEAVLVAQQYQDAARPVLTGRLQALTERSNQRRNELLQMAARKQQEYQAAWGPQSAQRSELLQGFKKIASLSKQRFTQAIQSGGDIARVYEARIDAIQTVQQAQELGATLAQDLADSTIQTWRSVCTQAQRQSLDLLVPFFQASDAMGNLLDVRQNLQPADLELADLLVNKLPDIKLDWWNQLRGIYGGVAVVLGAASLIHPIIGGTGYLTYGLALATIPRFRREIIANQVKSAQGQLRQYLQNDLQRLRVFFSEVDLATMRSHRVNEYFDTLECSMKEQVAALYNQKMTEAQEEARRLSEAAKLDDEERQAGVEQLRREIQEWEAIGTRLRAMAEGLKVLDRPVARTDVVPPYIEQVDEDQRVRASGQPAHGLRACAQLVDREVDG